MIAVSRTLLRAALLTILGAIAVPTQGEPLSLWEFGFGVGGLFFNDYRGAKNLLPFKDVKALVGRSDFTIYRLIG